MDDDDDDDDDDDGDDDDDDYDYDGDELIAVPVVLLLPRYIILLVEIPAAFGCSHVFQHTDSILATILLEVAIFPKLHHLPMNESCRGMG